MVSQLPKRSYEGPSSDIYYPVEDGKPLAETFESMALQSEIQKRIQAEERATRAEQAQREAAIKLFALNFSAEQVADTLGLSIEEVRSLDKENP